MIVEISKNLLRGSLGLAENEAFLVVTDEQQRHMAEALYEAGKQLGADAVMMTMKEREKSGQEPPALIAKAMEQADAVVCITKHSLSHTAARKQAMAAGTRIATMPGITEEMFLEGAITADYAKVKTLTETVTDVLSRGKQVRIEKDEYVLTFSIEGREGYPSTGVYVNPGESGNLPSGEAYIAPLEGTAHGQILIDVSLAGIGKLSAPLLLTIQDGKIVEATGEASDELLHLLGEHEGRCVGEFGIGTNDKARITGNILEDEKVYGTIHVAFGSNRTFGGTISAGVHIDGVVSKPTVYVDQVLFIQDGEIIL